MMEVFEKEYLRRKAPYEFIRAKAEDVAENETEIEVVFMAGQELKSAKAVGNGPLARTEKADDRGIWNGLYSDRLLTARS